MSTKKGQIKLGAFLQNTGHHVASWRHPDVPLDSSLDFGFYKRLAQTAERAKFDLVFLADGNAVWGDRGQGGEVLKRSGKLVRFEPLTLLSALSTVTEHVGLVATASTTYNEPYHIARKFASLDYLSGGRAGWNIVTSSQDAEAKNFSRDHHMDHALRYERAREFVQVTTGLWDSWDDDAFIRDKASGIYVDPDKVHVLNHKDKHFSVRGPLRSPDQLKIMPGIFAVIGQTEQEAKEKYDQLQDLIDPIVGLSLLSGLVGNVDLSAYPLDGPLPELPETNNNKSRLKLVQDLAGREKLTIRETYLAVAGARGHRTIWGTPVQIADQLEEWFVTDAADGFNIMPPYLPGGLDDFVELVVPELRRRGLFRSEYEGRTLRENLGLSRPTSQFGVNSTASASA